ncbi:MAG: hypothetical protein ACTHN2_03735 [Nitrobacter sp.]
MKRERRARSPLRNSIEFELDRHRVDGDGKFCSEIQTSNFNRIVALRLWPEIADNFILLSTPLFTFSIRACSVRVRLLAGPEVPMGQCSGDRRDATRRPDVALRD